jgi:hypothetical protein
VTEAAAKLHGYAGKSSVSSGKPIGVVNSKCFSPIGRKAVQGDDYVLPLVSFLVPQDLKSTFPKAAESAALFQPILQLALTLNAHLSAQVACAHKTHPPDGGPEQKKDRELFEDSLMLAKPFHK